MCNTKEEVIVDDYDGLGLEWQANTEGRMTCTCGAHWLVEVEDIPPETEYDGKLYTFHQEDEGVDYADTIWKEVEEHAKEEEKKKEEKE